MRNFLASASEGMRYFSINRKGLTLVSSLSAGSQILKSTPSAIGVILYLSRCGTAGGYIDQRFEEAEQFLLIDKETLNESGGAVHSHKNPVTMIDYGLPSVDIDSSRMQNGNAT